MAEELHQCKWCPMKSPSAAFIEAHMQIKHAAVTSSGATLTAQLAELFDLVVVLEEDSATEIRGSRYQPIDWGKAQ